MIDEAQPWERSALDDDETMWQAFVIYRDDPPRLRSLARASASVGLMYHDVCKRAETDLWRERVAEYDAWLDRELIKLRVADRRRYEERHQDLCHAVLETVATEVSRWQDEVRAGGLAGARRATIRDLARISDVFMRHERLLHGAETEHVTVDLQALSTDEIRELKRLQGLAQKK